MRILGYNSPSACTRSSVSFNGLELKLERKLVQAIKNENKGAYYNVFISAHQLASDETNESLPRQLVQDLVGRLSLITVNISGVNFLSRALRGKLVYTTLSLNFFNRRYRLLFLIVTSSSFSCCCIAARYPALNMLTAIS